MKQYILSVITVAIAASIVSALCPDGERGGLSRAVKLVSALCIILVCFAPAQDAITWLSELDIESVLPDTQDKNDEYESIFMDSYGYAEEQNLKEGIKSLLLDRFGIDPLCVEVSLHFYEGQDTRRLERVTLTLYGSAIFADTGEMERQLSSLLGCRIVTVIG